VEKVDIAPDPVFGAGTYCSSCRAGVDHARVVRLARRHAIPEPRGQQIGPVLAVHAARQRAADLGKIAAPLKQRRHRDEAGLDALRRPRALIVGKEEDPPGAPLSYWAADGAAGLLLSERRALG